MPKVEEERLDLTEPQKDALRQFEKKAEFFRISCIGYNVGRLVVLKTLANSWNRHQLKHYDGNSIRRQGKLSFLTS